MLLHGRSEIVLMIEELLIVHVSAVDAPRVMAGASATQPGNGRTDAAQQIAELNCRPSTAQHSDSVYTPRPN